jgi:hypothetical protein
MNKFSFDKWVTNLRNIRLPVNIGSNGQIFSVLESPAVAPALIDKLDYVRLLQSNGVNQNLVKQMRIDVTDRDIEEIKKLYGGRQQYLLDQRVLEQLWEPMGRANALEHGTETFDRIEKAITLKAEIQKMKLRWNMRYFLSDSDYQLYLLYEMDSNIHSIIDRLMNDQNDAPPMGANPNIAELPKIAGAHIPYLGQGPQTATSGTVRPFPPRELPVHPAPLVLTNRPINGNIQEVSVPFGNPGAIFPPLLKNLHNDMRN